MFNKNMFELTSLLVVILVSLSLNTFAQTPPNFTINNTASVYYSLETGGVGAPVVSNISINSVSEIITSPTGIAPTIKLGRFINTPASQDVLQAGSCNATSGVTQYNTVGLDSSITNLPANVNFEERAAISSSNSMAIQVMDANFPNDPSQVDSLTVRVNSQSGDVETIVLKETGINTGKFYGYVPVSNTNPNLSNCTLNVKNNDRITVTYENNGQQQTVSSTILVDPLGKVFDTATGNLINGATITLINVATGLPAQVFGDDGVSSYPSTVISGQDVTDGGGNLYDYNDGEYRFPLIAPGNYRLQITAPTGFSFPTLLSNAQINTLYPGQFVLTTGSRGEQFNVVATILEIDIPMDSQQGEILVVNKTASTKVAAIGDFVQYTITIQNTGVSTAQNVKLEDILPKGLRYVKGSLKVDNISQEPSFGKSNNMIINIPTIAANQTITLKYVSEISVATRVGRVKNTATASTVNSKSNLAQYNIEVIDELLMNKPIIIGTVFEANSCDVKDFKRMKNIKIQFETGDYVISDEDGLWHINNMSVGTHVAKIDKLSIPKGYEPVMCEKTNEFADSPDSRFVPSKPGLITKVDFYLKKTNSTTETVNTQLKIEEKSTVESKNKKSGTEALSLNDEFMKQPYTENKILFPGENFTPSTSAVGFAFVYNSLHKPQLYINGEKSSDFNFDGVRQSANLLSSIMYWRGLPLKPGKNEFEVKLYDDKNNLLSIYKKTIYYSSQLVNAIFVPDKSKLEANGNDTIEVAVRLLDGNGQPVHKGLIGNYEFTGNYTPYFNRDNGVPIDLVAARQTTTQFTVEENGIAYIKFMPTQQAGELSIKIRLLNNNIALIRPWINGLKRDWIFVGIADTTFAKNKKNNYREKDANGIELIEDNDGRVAFYGKGTVAKDFLLTLAYDNKKERINPNQVPVGQTGTIGLQEDYPIYGDSTVSQKDAQSASKFYIRIERDKFYALFGDYQTNINVTDLVQYNRVLNGFKSEYKNDKLSYSIFAAKDSLVAQREEVLSDGTTGPYRLANKPEILTEIVSIITRDKNQRDVILKTKALTRYIDYDIDYDLGFIRLKNPIAAYDLFFNPNFIRIEYSSENNNNQDTTVAGGRASYKVNENIEVGVSGVLEDSKNNSSNMKSTDIVYEKDGLRVRAEVANSQREENGVQTKGNGYSLEMKYDKEWGGIRAFTKKVDENYGVNSVLATDVGIEKTGAEINLKLDKNVTIRGALLSQKDLRLGSTQLIAEARVEKEFNPQTIAYVGAKTVRNEINQVSGGNVSKINDTANLVTVGGQYKIKDSPITLTGQAEINPKPSESIPSKYRVGAQYDVTTEYAVVADTEYSIFEDAKVQTNRVGVIARPFEGVKLQNYVGNLGGNESAQFIESISDRTFAYKDWNFNASFASRRWNKDLAKTVVPAGTLATYDNYSTYQLAALYSKDNIINQSRIEYRNGDEEDKLLFRNDFYYKLDKGFAVSLSEEYNNITSNNIEDVRNIVTGGLSYRDPKNINTVLAKVDLISQELGDVSTKKIVLNTHANHKPYNGDIEYNGHIGYKYVLQSFDQDEYDGSSFVGQIGIKKQLNDKFDIASEALYAMSTQSGVSSSGLNFSTGYLLAKNTWVALGYQYIKDYDRNFEFDDAYIKGFYIRLRIKFDEKSFHLNNSATNSQNNVFN